MTYPIKFIRNLHCSHGIDQAIFFHCTASLLSMYIIADGHSQREGSADLVNKFIQYAQSQQLAFQQLSDIESDVKDFIENLLIQFQESIKRELPRSAMSLMIVIVSPDYLHIFFLGDCRLGEVNGTLIRWLTRPHTCILQTNPDMSEDELRDSEHNHIVHKQFVALRREAAEYQKLDNSKTKYILCTDGFWKLSKAQQFKALTSENNVYDDDIAYLFFTTKN